MSDRGFTIRNQYAIHFITFAVVQWIDVFSRKEYADILVESLKYCQKEKGLKIHAWCIMSNHVHLIVSANRAEPSFRYFERFKKVYLNQHSPGNNRE